MTDEKIEYLKKFIAFCVKHIGIKSAVHIFLRKGRDEYISTTASYDINDNENHIRAGGRALIDIMRSVGHELTHNKQNEKGELVPTSGEDGSEHENEANSTAGVLIRKFGRENPRVYDL